MQPNIFTVSQTNVFQTKNTGKHVNTGFLEPGQTPLTTKHMLKYQLPACTITDLQVFVGWEQALVDIFPRHKLINRFQSPVETRYTEKG